MEWKEILLTGIAAVVSAGGAAIIVWLVSLIKGLKWVKVLRIDEHLDRLADMAVRYVENWAKNQLSKVASDAKLLEACKALQESAKKTGIKLDDVEAKKLIEAKLNELKATHLLPTTGGK